MFILSVLGVAHTNQLF